MFCCECAGRTDASLLQFPPSPSNSVSVHRVTQDNHAVQCGPRMPRSRLKEAFRTYQTSNAALSEAPIDLPPLIRAQPASPGRTPGGKGRLAVGRLTVNDAVRQTTSRQRADFEYTPGHK